MGTANHYLRSLPGHSNLLDAPAEQPSCSFAQGDLLLHRYCELDEIVSQSSSHLLRRPGSELCPHTGHTSLLFPERHVVSDHPPGTSRKLILLLCSADFSRYGNVRSEGAQDGRPRRKPARAGAVFVHRHAGMA